MSGGRKPQETAARQRGRPIAFDRETALRAALDLFWKRGFEAVTASDLAEAMAITRSSFYNSFGDREAVFKEALEVYKRLSPDAVLGRIAPGQPVVPVIRKMFREICRMRAADPEARGCLIVNAIGELVGVNEILSCTIEDAVRSSLLVWEMLIGQAADQSEIARPARIQATAQSFVTFIIGLNAISKILHTENELWLLCQDFLEANGMAGDEVEILS